MLELNATQVKKTKKQFSFESLEVKLLRDDPAALKEYIKGTFSDYQKTKNLEDFKMFLKVVVTALGVTNVSRKIKVDRSGLYKSLSPKGHPSFDTVFAILDMVGVDFVLRDKKINIK